MKSHVQTQRIAFKLRLTGLLLLIGVLTVTASAQQGFYLQVPQAPKIPAATFKITSYGGVGDGKTMNTDAFRKAIEACTNAGGGSVIVTSGTFLTGPIKLASKMALVLEKGAVVQASDRFADFGLPDPMPTTQSELNALKKELQPLISGSKLTDVAILGQGKIDGGGAAWWVKSDIAAQRGVQAVAQRGTAVTPGAPLPQTTKTVSPSPQPESNPESQVTQTTPGANISTSATNQAISEQPSASPSPAAKMLYVPRPHLIVLRDCERVHVQGVMLCNSPMFHFVPGRCQELLIEDVSIVTPSNAPNTDGIDPSNCRNVLIRRCYIDTGDDDIALKGGGNGAPPMENITVTDCRFGHGHGVSIGSETNAGVRNFLVQKCAFENTDNGLRIKSDRARGGLVDNVLYRDITMKNVGFPITIFLFYDDKKGALSPEFKPVTATTPKIRNVHFSNIVCDGASRKAIELAGLPESPLVDVQLENVRVTGAEVPMTVQDTKDLQIKNVEVTTPALSTPTPQSSSAQPQASPLTSPRRNQ